LVGCSPQSSQEIQKNNQLNESNSKTEDVINIVAFGDSLTAGYGLNISDAYPKQLETYLRNNGYNVKVYNSGLSGETTSAALSRVNWVMHLNPDIVILETGANDAFRGIDLNLTKTNIEKIVDIFEEKNVTVILAGIEMVENLGPDYVNKFENIYPEVSKNKNITLIRKFLGGVAGIEELNQKDRIHPTPEGYSIIVQKNIGPVVEEVLNKNK